MGCGSSSLKGDDVNNPAPKPAKAGKGAANFAPVDYEADARARRMTEYAPDQTKRPSTQHERNSQGDVPREENKQDTELKPYQSNPDHLAVPQTQYGGQSPEIQRTNAGDDLANTAVKQS